MLADVMPSSKHAVATAVMAIGPRQTHNEPKGIAVRPGETRELTYAFAQAGGTLAGCHVAGHYAGGMKAAITISR